MNTTKGIITTWLCRNLGKTGTKNIYKMTRKIDLPMQAILLRSITRKRTMVNKLLLLVLLLSTASFSQAAFENENSIFGKSEQVVQKVHVNFPEMKGGDLSLFFDGLKRPLNPHQVEDFKMLMESDESYAMLLSLKEAKPNVNQVLKDVMGLYQRHETDALLTSLIKQQKRTNQLLENFIKENKHA